jgi:hypothetical protein
MINISDNLTHLLQLALLLAAGCVLIIFAPSIPPIAVLTLLSTPVGILLGAKVSQTATNAANAVNALPAPVLTPKEPEPIVPPFGKAG